MSHLTRLGNPNVFASLPFDQIDGFAGAYMHDDFITAATLADTTRSGAVFSSEYLWWGAEIGTNDEAANVLVIPAEADHQGIIQLQTGAVSPADGDGISFQFGSSIIGIQDCLLLDDNGVYIASVLRIPDIDAQNVEFALIGQDPATFEPNSGGQDNSVGFAWDPADANNVGDEFWFSQVNLAGTDTEVVATLPYVQDDWCLLEIGATDTSASYRITTEDGTETTELIQSQPTVALRPYFASANIGANEELLEIDLFHMRFLRRDSLVGQGADWLGA